MFRGAGKYVDDIKLPNMLHMMVARSPHAHARVLSVKGGLNGNDLKAIVERWRGRLGRTHKPCFVHPAFAQDTVYYVGQPVAAVFADDRYAAEDKLDEVEVEYEKLKPIMTTDEALSKRPNACRNAIKHYSCKVGWAQILKTPNHPLCLEDEFTIARIANNPLEPRVNR